MLQPRGGGGQKPRLRGGAGTERSSQLYARAHGKRGRNSAVAEEVREPRTPDRDSPHKTRARGSAKKTAPEGTRKRRSRVPLSKAACALVDTAPASITQAERASSRCRRAPAGVLPHSSPAYWPRSGCTQANGYPQCRCGKTCSFWLFGWPRLPERCEALQRTTPCNLTAAASNERKKKMQKI